MDKDSNKNKIVFILPNLKIGGAQRVFVNYLRKLNIKKFKIHLILINEIGPFRELIPSRVNVINLNRKRSRFGLFQLLKYINKIDPDLVVSTTNYLNILVLICSFLLKNRLKICLYEPSMPSAQISNNHFPKYYFWLIKLLYRRSDYIIAQTEEMKEEIIKFYSPPKNEIIVTSNPIDESLIGEQTRNQKNPYNFEKINVVVSGRISEEKGQDVLIKAFKNVVSNDNKFQLNILGSIGSQVYFEELQSIIIELDIADHVEFLGFKSNPYPFYKYADLLVLPSRWEGLPNVVLEALFLKTPVVVTNCITFFERLIKNGINGFIVDVDDQDGMSLAIQNYHKLKVDKDVIPKVDMEKIFEQMIIHA